ncbi:MAG: hypothetical protein ACMXYK_04165 [Candidatus Woesearchaeota archaeon]
MSEDFEYKPGELIVEIRDGVNKEYGFLHIQHRLGYDYNGESMFADGRVFVEPGLEEKAMSELRNLDVVSFVERRNLTRERRYSSIDDLESEVRDFAYNFGDSSVRYWNAALDSLLEKIASYKEKSSNQ